MVYETVFFKTLGIRQPKVVKLERWKTNKVSPMIVPVSAVREFLGSSAERESIGETWRTP